MPASATGLIQSFAKAFSLGDAGQLAPFLGEELSARFEETGKLDSRRNVLDFWRRLFESYPEINLRIFKIITDESLVIAEQLYELKPGWGKETRVRTVSVFEIKHDLIVSWVDHADLTDVPGKERDLWRRLGAARW